MPPAIKPKKSGITIHKALELFAARKVDGGVPAALKSADNGSPRRSRNQRSVPSDDRAAITRPRSPRVSSSGASVSSYIANRTLEREET